MDTQRFLRESKDRISEDGLIGLEDSLYEFYQGFWTNVGKYYNYGTNIYDFDWDVLVVIDGCRSDLLCDAANQYSMIDGFNSIYSVASASHEWMTKTFNEKYSQDIDETIHVTGNPHTDQALTADLFMLLDEVWRYQWDDDLGTIPARPITNQAVKHYRKHSPDRMIIHYMQPHFPSIPNPEIGSKMDPSTDGWDSVWDSLRRGKIDQQEVIKAYTENLGYILDEVEFLTQNLAAESLVITSDHGNLLGEFGLYGHPSHVPFKPLKEVPWIECRATDTGDFDPVDYKKKESNDVESRLKSLGYV